MAGEINFGLLRTPDFSQALMGGFEEGRARGNQVRADSALAQYQANPDDGVNMTALLAADPVRGTAIVRARQQAQESEQSARARQSYGAAVAEIGLPPALQQLALDDPQGAMKLWEFKQNASKDQLEAAAKQNEVVANLVGTVVDEGSYQAALQQAASMGLDVSTLPQQYDPQFIDRTRRQALGVKGVLDWQDKEADNRARDQGLQLQANGQAITLRGQDMVDARARQQIGATGDAVSKTVKRDEGDLRKQFEGRQEVKDWRAVSQSFRQIRSAAAAPSAQNDIAIIFSYMKMLDPGSVVREGEFATAQNAAGVPDRIRNMWNKAQEGERLNPSQRQGMVASAAAVVNSAKPRFDAIANEYRGYASDYGANPDRVAKASPDAKPKAAPASSGWSIKPKG